MSTTTIIPLAWYDETDELTWAGVTEPPNINRRERMIAESNIIVVFPINELSVNFLSIDDYDQTTLSSSIHMGNVSGSEEHFRSDE